MEAYEDRNGILVPHRAKLIVGGTFIAQLLRDGKIFDEWEQHNLVVNQGLDHLLATEFTGSAQVTQWYLAPFGNNYAPVGTDTAASISANAGEVVAYSGGARQLYNGVEGGQQVTNAAAPASFTFTAPGTIYGAFMISSSAFGSTAGFLFAASQFTAQKVVATGDQLLLTYVFGAVSA